MPGTAVASRKNSWKRIKHKYKVHTKEYYAKKLASIITKKKEMQTRKSLSKKK